MRIRFFLVLLLICCGMPAAHAASAAASSGSVSVRAGSHADHDRLVIDFQGGVGAELSGTAPDYTITFDQPVSLAVPNLGKLKRIASASQTSDTQLTIHVQPGQVIKISRAGNKLVIDAIGANPAAAKGSASPVQLAPWTEDQDAGGPAPNLAAQIKKQMANVNSLPSADKPSAPTKTSAMKPAAVDANATSGPGGRPLTLAELAAQDAEKAKNKPADKSSGPDKSQAADALAEPQTFAALPTGLPAPTAVAQMKLQVPTNAKFAAFMRGRKFWIVLDQPVLAMPTDENGADSNKFGPTSRYQIGGGTGTAYRIQLNENQFPALTKSDDGVLLFTLYSQAPLVMPVGLPVEVENSPDSGPRLKITGAGFAPPLTVSDPDIGDHLIIVPGTADAGSVTDEHRWPQVETLPALHGIVVNPLVDNLLVDASRKGVIIGRPPKGLTLSGVKGLVDPHDKGNGELIYDLNNWRISSFENFRRTRAELESNLVDIRGADRLQAIMRLARFMFAQGYPQEANGWLRIAAQEFPTAVNIPEYVLLQGAVHVAMRDIYAGDRELSLQGYAYEPEVALWRGYAAAEAEDYQRARYFFGLARDLLNDYPDPYFKPIAFAAAETALLTGDAVAGGALVTRIEKRQGLLSTDWGQIHYLRGLQARLNGQEDEAENHWDEAKKNPNKIYAAKAELAEIQDGLQQKTLKPEDAIKRLDELRVGWRGDSTELATLTTLAPLQMDKQDARAAFECWQTIIRYFPNDQTAEIARQNISSNLSKLFDDQDAIMQKPIETLALYHDFIDYSPTSQVAEQITRRLIDDLTALGLYHEAADIYLPLVKPPLDPGAPEPPPPKTEDIFRLAGIYLLDGDTAGARNVLKDVDSMRLPLPDNAEYRLLLARADYQDGKLDDALAQLGDLADENTNRMRADIYWRQQKWADAAKVLPSLVGEIKDNKLSDAQTRNILEQAVALSLASNQPGVDALREKYSAMMDQTDQGAAFRLVTLPPKGSELQSVKSIQSRLGDVDDFSSFLQGYRKLDAIKKPADTAAKPADANKDTKAAAPDTAAKK